MPVPLKLIVGFWPMANAVEQKNADETRPVTFILRGECASCKETMTYRRLARPTYHQGYARHLNTLLTTVQRLEQVDMLSLRLKAESMAHMMLTAVEYGIWALAIDEQCEQMKYGQSGFCTDVVMPCLSLKDDNNAH